MAPFGMRLFGTALFGMALLLVLGTVSGLAAQDPWNSPRTLELVERATERRAAPYEDSALVNYRADATGFVYFYLDRQDTDERTLVKTDQVALEVYWEFPGSTRQRIVGLRDESVLPNRMRYHLDHLTVVQNEFDDRIHLGDGDEVRSVMHPVAPGAAAVYDYRLADSLTLRLGNVPEPLRVYEVEVRPRDPGQPAIIGSVFLDRATADIVRMDFTFTPASYVDDRLDYIRISLENGLWQGRFWLPYRQKAELRRQVPELDFPAGGVIRADMRVGNYQFNQPIPEAFFRGPRVTTVPEEMREAYPFEEGLFSQLEEQGLEREPDLEALGQQARDLVAARYLSGLPRLRLDIRGASSVLRYNRAEGLFLGTGVMYALGSATEARLGGGWAFGPDAPEGRLALGLPLGGGRLEAAGWYNRPRDIDRPTVSGAMNTLSSLAAEAGAEFGYDFQDLYFTRGGGLHWSRPLDERWTLDVATRAERHVGAGALASGFTPDSDDELNRPLAAIAEGDAFEAVLGVERTSAVPAGIELQADIVAGVLDQDRYVRLDGHARREFGHPASDWRASLSLRAGAALGGAPAQRLFYLGGRGTVPGFAYRARVGDRFANVRASLARRLLDPWLELRLIGAVGWTDLTHRDSSPFGSAGASVAELAIGAGNDDILPSIGIGIGVFHDILRFEWSRGLRHDGEWELLVSAAPRLRDIL